MAVLSTVTKGKITLKAAGAAWKNPGLTRFAAKPAFQAGKTWLGVKAVQPAAKAMKPAVKAVKPATKAKVGYGKALAKRRARRRVASVGETARTVGEVLLIQAPEAAQELGFIEKPAPKRTAPRVAAGVVIGASAMYLLEPGEPGRQHREKVMALVS
jgi:hypothetical protein